MENFRRCDLTRDLALPTLLFAALGAMSWAVRGCSGFGATVGCIFAGVLWGAAWWFLARDPAREQSRRCWHLASDESPHWQDASATGVNGNEEQSAHYFGLLDFFLAASGFGAALLAGAFTEG